MERDQILNENNSKLRQELAAALETIKSYEAIIADLQNENSNNLKKASHDLANPLQILSMTIESLEDRAPKEMIPTIERMKRSTDMMATILENLRKLRSQNINNKISKVV